MTRHKPSANECGEESLAEHLQNTFAPTDLDATVQRRLIEQALGASSTATLGAPSDASANEPPASERECREATLLAQALEGKAIHPLASLANTLRHAHHPHDLASAREAALRTDIWRRRRLLQLRMAAYAATVLAAGLGIIWGKARQPDVLSRDASVPYALIGSRSVAPLFDIAERRSTATERIDRIYSMRSRDLRHNRFATWGVR
jgi:hypothetical protein